MYPLGFLNGGATGSITVTATAPDTQVRATLWRVGAQSGNAAAQVPGEEWWQAVASGSGASVDLTVPAPAGGNLTDGTYVLAVAPLDFDSPARSYAIDVSAALIGRSYDHSTHTATFKLLANLPNGNYVATLLASGVTDGLGRPLSGNHTLSFYILASDFNRDRVVNHLDFNILFANFNSPAANTFEQGDGNGDGKVNFADFQKLERDFGASVPLPPPPAPPTPAKPVVKHSAKQPVAKTVTKPTPKKPLPKAGSTLGFSTSRIAQKKATLA